jgi:hypothetical protein
MIGSRFVLISMYVAADIYINELPIVIACKHVEGLFYGKIDVSFRTLISTMPTVNV